MAYDSVRAQLDKLLGPDRNGPLTAASTTPTDYRHPDICKNYLLGFCPNDLHIKHRSEPGSCRRRHSDAAKDSFEKDVAASKANREKARWTASLLAECRAIVVDEDRKIRCHARRLKETYNAQGDLAGLMIQNFDTLKKLGMVSQDASIRVLNQIDDDELPAGPASDEVVEQKEEPSRQPETGHGEPNTPTLPLRGQSQTTSPQRREQDQLPVDQSKTSNKKGVTENDDEDDADDDADDDTGDDANEADDDDDDFGLIKVIPAVNNTSQDPEKPIASLPEGSEQSVAQVRDGTRPSGADMDESAAKATSKTLKTEVGNPLESENSSTRKPGDSTEKSLETHLGKGRTRETSEGHNNGSESDSEGAIREEHGAKFKATPGEVTDSLQGNDGIKSSPSDDVEKTEKTPNAVRSVPSMEEYYERGLGPDGLLMLDRKQSLRVCACCGGYISLVDAESRLLSHYGGKTHHSLAQLRKKVAELEAEASVEPVSRKSASRIHVSDRSEGRDRAWSYRRNERRYSRERYGKGSERYQDRHGSGSGAQFDDRRRVRSRRDGRGFGTAEWYNNYVYDNADRHSLRPGDRPSSSDRQSPRYSNGRKRYRSRSPIRDNRRPRRYY